MTVVEPINPVLFLLGTLEIGGSETKIVRLANAMHKRGLPVHLAYLRPPAPLLKSVIDLPVVHLEQNGKWSLGAYRNLKRYVADHGIGTIVNVNLYPLAYSSPMIRLNPELDVVDISSINTSELESGRDRLFMLLYAQLLRRSKKLVFGSEGQMNDWIKKYRLPDSRATVIYNGVDGSRFSMSAVDDSRPNVRDEFGMSAADFVVVCVSQFRAEKGQTKLLQAVRILSEKYNLRPRVLLVGDGPERANIVSASTEFDIEEQVSLAGAVDDVRPYLAAADLFALPSTAVETFSNAALEAGAMGIPCVISDLGGASEMFPPGSSGVVYDRNDVEGLAEIIHSKMSVGRPDESTRARIRQEILERFDIERMVDQWCGAIWPNGSPQASSP